MEINNHVSHLSHKDIPTTLYQMHAMPHINLSPEADIHNSIQSQLVNIDKFYRFQEETLIQEFEQQRRLLQTEQQIKMQEQIKQKNAGLICPNASHDSSIMTLPPHLQMLMLQKRQQIEQTILEQQQAQKQLQQQQQAVAAQQAAAMAAAVVSHHREERSDAQIARIKNKPQGELSAIASDPVKAKLRECLLQKSSRDPSLKNSPPTFRNWATQHSSLEQNSPPTSGLSPPLRGPQLLAACYDDENTLRRTASEPNLKVRLALKQKMIERRSSPLLKRRDRHLLKRNANPLTVNTGQPHSNPDSGPNTPPSGLASQGSSTETPPSADKDKTFPLHMMNKMVNQSMPNISIGQHRVDPGGHLGDQGPPTEADIRARLAAQYGLPLTGHTLTGPLPLYPMPSVLEGHAASADPSYIEAQMKALEIYQSTGKLPQLPQLSPGGMSAAAAAASGGAINVSPTDGSRGYSVRSKLSRTHSAPLPLPGQLLLQHQLLMQQHELLKESNPRHYLKQKLQTSILQRSGSKNTMENVDEETEARLAQELREVKERQEEEILVIDDTHHHPNPPLTGREALLQKMKARTFSAESNTSLTVPIPSEKLMRAQSYPTVRIEPDTTPQHSYTTGLAYDSMMLKHACVCGDNSIHAEHPGRLQSIYARFHETKLLSKCHKVQCRKATLDEIKSCHSEAYALLYGSSPQKLAESNVDPKMFEPLLQRFCKLSCGGVGVDADTVWNESQTPTAARVAAGSVTSLAMKVAGGELSNGFALVRPPGHHAEPTLAMGFCYFNSIAIAAKQLLNKMNLKKILIVDWDVHHGNSTQQIFYADPRVLYISLHRHDSGNFFPGTGAPEECGIDRGIGYNVNVAFSGALDPPMGDAEYMAAFRCLVMPIAREFEPEFVLVSAGFDGAEGHPAPLGGYNISPTCFGHMTKQLMTLANGKVVLALEGGYELQSICDASEYCMKALLGEQIPDLKEEELLRVSCEPGLETLENSLRWQAPYWSSIQRYAHTIRWSLAETRQHEHSVYCPPPALLPLSGQEEDKTSPQRRTTQGANHSIKTHTNGESKSSAALPTTSAAAKSSTTTATSEAMEES